jgi:hypothetical protein
MRFKRALKALCCFQTHLSYMFNITHKIKGDLFAIKAGFHNGLSERFLSGGGRIFE